MAITRKNYEIYFTDYLDGTLSTEQSGELKVFLLLNPDLEELLDDISTTRLIPSEIHFSAKDSLKKSNIHECPDYYAIAASEEVLSSEEQKIIARRMDDPVFRQSVNFYKTIKLQPDPGISFNKKKSLYRQSPGTLWMRSAAAVILLLLGTGLSLLLPTRPADIPETEIIPVATVIHIPDNPVTDTEKQAEIQIVPPRHNRKISEPEKELPEPPGARKSIESIKEIIPMQVAALVHHNQPEMKIDIIRHRSSTDEISLNEEASAWKPSGSNVRSSDIFTSMFQAGKIFSEKIKEKMTENRSNKFLSLSVIR